MSAPDLTPARAGAPGAARGAGLNVRRVVSALGIEAWLVERHAVPLVALDFALRGGAVQDAPGRGGSAAMLAHLLDEGAGPLDAAAFQERLEERAIELSFRHEKEAIGGRLRTLARHRGEAFDLLGLALSDARLDEDAIERARAALSADLRAGLTEPSGLAHRAWNARAYGAHPYARPGDGTLEEVAGVARADLADLRARTFARDRLAVSVVGAVTPEELGPLLDRAFGGLPALGAAAPPPFAAPGGIGERLLIDLDVPQSTIRFGCAGPLRDDPDFIAATVANHVLGGGSFTSRLWREVREERGLAYGVGSGLSPLERAGQFKGSTATSNERVPEALGVIEAAVRRFAAEGPDEAELAGAKRYLTGSYALRFDTSSKIAAQLTGLQRAGLGPEYLTQRNALVEAVTPDDARAASARMLGDGRLLVAIAGRPKGL